MRENSLSGPADPARVEKIDTAKSADRLLVFSLQSLHINLIISALQKLYSISGHLYTFRLFSVEIPYPYSLFFQPVPVHVPEFPNDSVYVLFPYQLFQI